MAKSNYTYRIQEHSGRKVIVIEDLNLGNMSVTNNIEEVVAEIYHKEGINLSAAVIVYRDSEGVWDGWNHDMQDFVPLNETHWAKPAEKYIDKVVYNMEKIS